MTNITWTDVFMRKNFEDTGNLPSQGGLTSSPDIIPNGTDLIQAPVTTLANNWSGPDAGKATTLNQPNYIYVRAKNLFPRGTSAKIELYHCPSHLFLFPYLWMDNQLKTSDGETSVQATSANPGDVMVPDQPFIFIPTDTEHHCYISRVITYNNPNILPYDGEITDLNALAMYIHSHPNMAWRNIELVQSDIPNFYRTFNIDTGSEDCRVMIYLECKNIKGSIVSFSCGTPIPSGPDAGNIISLPQTQVTQDSMILGAQIFSLPKYFSTKITYSYLSNQSVQKDWQLNFHAVLMVNMDSELYQRADHIHKLGLHHPLPTKGINIGSIFTFGNYI